VLHAGRVDDLDGLGHDLGADAVAADDADAVGHWFLIRVIYVVGRVSVGASGRTNEKPPTEVDGRTNAGARRSSANNDDGEVGVLGGGGPGCLRGPTFVGGGGGWGKGEGAWGSARPPPRRGRHPSLVTGPRAAPGGARVAHR